MKQLRNTSIIFFMIILLSAAVAAQSPVDTEKLDRYFSGLEEHNRFMGSVALMSGDEVVFNRAYGKIDENGKPATRETIYLIGSISKSYTAAMIMQLIEQDDLSLDTTLDEFYPSIPEAEKITIEHLLSHQSGLVNFTNLPEYQQYHTESHTREELFNRFENAGTSFEPGENREYSNTGYVLLSFIVEDLTGQSYAEALSSMITQPLSLTDTYFGTGIEPEKGEAESFTYSGNEWSVAPQTDISIPMGAGGIVSTSAETAQFFHALLNGELLSQSSLDKMTTFEGSFGLGLLQFPFNDKHAIGHNGGIDGFQSSAAHFRDDDITYAITANAVNYGFNDILIGFLSITFGLDYEIPDFAPKEEISLTESQMEAYTGTYSSPEFPLDISILIEDGNLMAQATGQGPFPLTALSEIEMVFEQADIKMVFEEKSNQKFNAFNFSQAGNEFRFTLNEE